MIFRVIWLAMGLVVAMALSAAAQQGNDGTGGVGGDMGGDMGGGSSAGLSSTVTKSLTRALKRDIIACESMNFTYRFDCYRQAYVLASKRLNGRPAYAEAQRALDHVADTLDRIVSDNADTQAPKGRRVFQTFTPIKPEAVPRAKRDFSKALDEAETILLRSSDKAGDHYARIAEVVHSNKVLLRSQLPSRTMGATRVV